MLEVNNINYEGYDAYQLKTEELSLIILPAVGGRIVSYTYKEHEFLYTIPELKGGKYNLEGIVDIESYRKDLAYVPAGGYKTWLAPQSKWGWPPYLDLAIGDYEVAYEVDEKELKFEVKSPCCRETGMRLTRTIFLNKEDKKVRIKQGMKNSNSDNKQEYGLWDVTQVQGSGQVIFPLQSKEDLIFLNQSQSDSIVEIIEVEQQLLAVVDCQGQQEFKLGTSFSAGWMLTVLETPNRKLGYLKEFPVFVEATFGHECALEVFDTYKYDYFEVEVHGPVKELKPKQSTSFTEEWSSYQWNKSNSLKEIILDLKERKSKV